MEKEFEDYWNAHRKRMLLNAPRELREEYLESTKLDSPMDWVCFVLPVAVGILVQPHIHFASEILMDYSAAHRGGAFCLVADGEADVAEKENYYSGDRAD